MENKISKQLVRLHTYIILLNLHPLLNIETLSEKDSISIVLLEEGNDDKLEISINNIRKKPENIASKEIDIICDKLQVYRKKYNL